MNGLLKWNTSCTAFVTPPALIYWHNSFIHLTAFTISLDPVSLQTYDNKEDLPRLEGSPIIKNFACMQLDHVAAHDIFASHLHVLSAFDFPSYVAFDSTSSDWMHPIITVDYAFQYKPSTSEHAQASWITPFLSSIFYGETPRLHERQDMILMFGPWNTSNYTKKCTTRSSILTEAAPAERAGRLRLKSSKVPLRVLMHVNLCTTCNQLHYILWITFYWKGQWVTHQKV